MEMTEKFKLDYDSYQKWLTSDSEFLQIRAKEILPYMDLVKEMAEALEKYEGHGIPTRGGLVVFPASEVLKKFKEWK